jgi:deoxyribose-phosphate aldolase
MKLNSHVLARMMDFSIVRPEVDEKELIEFAANVTKYRFIGAHVLPYYVAELNALIKGCDDVLIGTGIGFPFGNHKTAVKVHEAKLALEDGCRELDMVINISALLSGRYQYVRDDIRAIVDTASGKTVKVIFEVHYLKDYDIEKGCECCMEAGARFVKTATGHAATGATPHNISLMKKCVGDSMKIKASGGIRDLKTMMELYRLGAERFGIGSASALKIIDECNALPGGVVEV